LFAAVILDTIGNSFQEYSSKSSFNSSTEQGYTLATS
jgi:hypothetical protein